MIANLEQALSTALKNKAFSYRMHKICKLMIGSDKNKKQSYIPAGYVSMVD